MRILNFLRHVILLGIIVCVVLGVIGYLFVRTEPPKVKDAPYAIQTYSTDGLNLPARKYYASAVENADGKRFIPIGASYWTYDGKAYHKHNVRKETQIKYLAPNARIIRRSETKP